MEIITNITKNGVDLEHICSWLSQKCLKFHDELSVMISYNNALLDRLGNDDIELKAITEKTRIKGRYNIVLRSDLTKQSFILALCHEFVHMGQMEEGRLVCDYENRKFYWEGKEYGVSTKYDCRPWEIEAFKIDNKLYREYRKL